MDDDWMVAAYRHFALNHASLDELVDLARGLRRQHTADTKTRELFEAFLGTQAGCELFDNAFSVTYTAGEGLKVDFRNAEGDPDTRLIPLFEGAAGE
jgi:hypothetical protein